MKKYDLKNWFVIQDPRDQFMAPELRPQCLGGDRGDNDCLTTPIMGKTEDGYVVTRSGSHYKLLDVDPAYEAEYPDALNRLMNSLKLM
jgi:hypothetical protein